MSADNKQQDNGACSDKIEVLFKPILHFNRL